MIGLLTGTVELFDGQSLILDVNGVGYKVFIANDVLSKTKIGDRIKLFINSHIREDLFDLYGFLDIQDLKLFENLLNVSGIGPKTALSIFSFGNRGKIINSVLSADLSFFTTVPRLGKKNAQKIIIELKTKLGSLQDLDLSIESSKENNEIMEALKSFGFTSKEISDAIKSVGQQETSAEGKIKLALKYLGK